MNANNYSLFIDQASCLFVQYSVIDTLMNNDGYQHHQTWVMVVCRSTSTLYKHVGISETFVGNEKNVKRKCYALYSCTTTSVIMSLDGLGSRPYMPLSLAYF